MIPEQLANIQARADAATEGPWILDGFEDEVKSVMHIEREVGIILGRYIADTVERDADAEFIAAARTDVPALLAMVREQRAALDAVRRIVSSPDFEGYLPVRVDAEPIRAALNATEGAA